MGELVARLVREPFREEQPSAEPHDARHRALHARRCVQGGHAPLREADENAAVGGQPVLVQQFADVRLDDAPRFAQPFRPGVRRFDREPAPAKTGLDVGLRRVRRVEGHVGEAGTEGHREADEVVPVGAEAVQQDAERVGGAARVRFAGRSVEYGHGVSPS